MCGIAGYLTRNERNISSTVLQAMCDTLTHRGPDSSGYLHRNHVGLGHRRLSIIDVAGGDQPLGNEDGSVQVVFNGEIYNYRELRADLIKNGHAFATNTDTEVLVHLYEEVGSRLPELLNGMFAFAIWDDRRRELFLARDRFGKKPLYYSTGLADFHICFASELKALLELPGFDRTVNPRSVANFLRLSYVPDPDTIFKHAQKLEPAQSLLVSEDRLKTTKYWRPSFEVNPEASWQASKDELLHLALDSVDRRMISDVPLGGFLSGGVDSSAVIALMSERSASVKSFSIGFSNDKFDELDYARLVADRFQTEHFEHVVTPSVEEMLGTLVKHYDEPFADSSAIPTLYLARMTREYVTVALSGDGTDELFGGYRRYKFAVAEERIRNLLPAALRRTVVGSAARYYPKLDSLPRPFRAKATLAGIAQELGGAYFSAMTAFGWGLYDRILSKEIRESLAGYCPREWFVEKFESRKDLPPLQQLQAVDLETYLPGDILVKVDRATMAFSLEARCPWLDYRIGDLAGGLPASFKLRNGVGKLIVKEVMRPRLPAGIIDRPKMGFSVPLAEWLRTRLRPVFEVMALRSEMASYFDLDVVAEIWETHQRGRRDYGRELWTILMLACWSDLYAERGRGSKLTEALAVGA